MLKVQSVQYQSVKTRLICTLVFGIFWIADVTPLETVVCGHVAFVEFFRLLKSTRSFILTNLRLCCDE